VRFGSTEQTIADVEALLNGGAPSAAAAR
jgi:hypothetical protein